MIQRDDLCRCVIWYFLIPGIKGLACFSFKKKLKLPEYLQIFPARDVSPLRLQVQALLPVITLTEFKQTSKHMENITAQQNAMLDQLRESGLSKHYWSNELGVAWYARGEFGVIGSAPVAAIQSFLSKWGILFGPPEISSSLQFIRTRTDSIGWRHFEFQQMYRIGPAPAPGSAGDQRLRLEVVGGYMSFHISQANELVEVQSSCWRDVSLSTGTPTIDEKRARLLLSSLSHDRATGRPIVTSTSAARLPGTLVVLPHEGGFKLAWKVEGLVTGKQRPEDPFQISLPGVNFIDAHTGEKLRSILHGAAAENPDNGSGLSNLPFGGPYNNRPLSIVRVDATNTYRLRDTTHSRDIITFDWGGDDPDYFGTAQRITEGSVPLSSDTDGDKNWSDVAADTSIGELTASQQTEVDAHYETGRVYEWYDAIAGPGGREGFDDNNYGSNVPSNMPVYNLAHVNVGNAQFYAMANDAGKRVSYLSFSDSAEDGTRAWAGSPFVVCHEYHHGITQHSVGSSIPEFPTTFNGWSRAVSEGLSDVFGGMYSKAWYAGAEISETGTMLRNLAFPRDPDAKSLGKDHWADRDTDGGNAYPRGQILAHCAYLLDQGGVHQRSGRTPELIPVHPLGTEEIGGVQVSVCARIWYRMMSTRFATVEPYDVEASFEKIRTECVASAVDLYGSGSDQHRAVVQAFYAVGLHPAGETYGADVTALRWGASWQFSVPYLGIPTPSWSSVDLFINNGGTSEWNAIINVEGSDELVENSVYCRVRNIGDQSASNVNVTFEYAKHGTAPVVWTAMQDAEGNIQTLNIPSLAAGESNFSMDEQNTPPDTARVMWSVPPHAPDEEVDHYCIRASITASNDVNPQNKNVQSNVAYFMMASMKIHSMAFHIGNPKRKSIRARLRITHTLPEGWVVTIRENINDILLQPLTEQVVHLDVKRPEGTSVDDDTRCSPPYDGEITGKVWGCISGPVSGTLTQTTTDGSRIQGHVAVKVTGSCTLIVGRLKGRLDCEKGKLTGTITGSHACGGSMKKVCIPFEGSIRPIRRIEIEQFDDNEILGGVSFQLQLPG